MVGKYWIYWIVKMFEVQTSLYHDRMYIIATILVIMAQK